MVVVASIVAACGGDESASTTTFPDDFSAERCLVRIHGRSEQGAAPLQRDGFAELAPDANEAFDGGGRVWVYDTDDSFGAARDAVTGVLDAAQCEVVALHGFSNGAAFTAKLVCEGETFDGRLVGAVIDDPVPDDSSPECAPADSVDVAVYWTGALTEAVAGASCEDLGYTCAGGDSLVGIDTFAERLDAPVQESVHDEHVAHDDAPELQRWLTGA